MPNAKCSYRYVIFFAQMSFSVHAGTRLVRINQMYGTLRISILLVTYNQGQSLWSEFVNFESLRLNCGRGCLLSPIEVCCLITVQPSTRKLNMIPIESGRAFIHSCVTGNYHAFSIFVTVPSSVPSLHYFAHIFEKTFPSSSAHTPLLMSKGSSVRGKT